MTARTTVDEAQLESYRRNGYLVVSQLLSAEEAAELRAAGHGVIERLSESHSVEATWSSATRAVDVIEPTALYHCHDVQFHDAAFSRLLTDARIVDVTAALLGTPNVQLHHNKLFIKPPRTGSPFPMHQDWPFFPHANDSTMAMILHLDDAPEDKGPLRIVPGSHLGGRIEHVGPTDWHLPPDHFPLEEATLILAEAGDAVFFSCLTIHGSGLNLSDDARTTWLLQMRDAADEPTVDRHKSPGQGMMLSGSNIGPSLPPSTL